jgi:hypothetical protein
MASDLMAENLLIAAAVWVLLSAFTRAFPKLKAHKVWARLAPVLPIVLCSGAVWIPGTVDPELGIGSRIVLGIVLGALAANGHKILGQTILGKDERIKGGK